jgi:hypothetical protein
MPTRYRARSTVIALAQRHLWYLTMNADNRARRTVRNSLMTIAAAVAVIAVEPGLAGATLLSNYYTYTQTDGFIARTIATRAINVYVESDVSVGSYSDWFGNSGVGDTEVNTTLVHCYSGGSFSASSSHSAYDPSTSEYEWAASGGSGNCHS